MWKQKCWNLLAVLVGIIFFTQISYATTIDKIVVFGDSLSDNGNIYAITKKLNKLGHLVPIVPRNPPYYEGRFTNGTNWIENLANKMNVPLEDYAYGGSWAESDWGSGILIPFNLGMQVNYYLVEEIADFHKDNHLFVIWSGSNDYIQGRDDAESATTATVNKIKEQIDWLVYYGAKNFLVLSVPDVSRTPEVIAKGPDFIAETKKLVTLHNQKLAEMLAKEQIDRPNIKFVAANIDGYFDDLFSNPTKYGLKNVKDACYGGPYYFDFDKRLLNSAELKAAKDANLDIMNNASLRVAYLNAKLADRGQQPCNDQDVYLFWDQIHPTRIVHGVIASLALGELLDHDIHGLSKV